MTQQTEHNHPTDSRDDLIRIAEARRIAGGVSPATIYRWIAQGRFPAPYKPTSHTSFWKRGEIQEWKARLSQGTQAAVNIS